MNHKNERIWKLHAKGMTLDQIVRKTGLPVERVALALARIPQREP